MRTVLWIFALVLLFVGAFNVGGSREYRQAWDDAPTVENGADARGHGSGRLRSRLREGGPVRRLLFGRRGSSGCG